MAKTKHPVQEFFEDAGIECRSYSGRAMYGRQCLGVEVDSLGELFVSVLEGVEGEDDTQDLQRAFRDMRTDSMGLGVVVYFPSVPFVGDDEEEDEDHECEGESCCT